MSLDVQLNSQLPLLEGNPFSLLAELLDGIVPQDCGAPIVASVGDPQGHCPVPTDLIAASANLWGRYPPLAGTPDLRASIEGWLRRRFDLGADWLADQVGVLPVAGTREALFLSAIMCVPQSKHGASPLVLLPNPCYPGYYGGAIMSGGQPVLLPASCQNGFLPQLAKLDEETLSRTAMAYLTNPSNPEGAAASENYLAAAVELSLKHDFILAVDECSIDLYTHNKPCGVLAVCEARSYSTRNLLVFNSLSKRSYAAGLRSGFVAGGTRLIERMRLLRSYAGATIPMPIQAASAALWADDDHGEIIRKDLDVRFSMAEEILGNELPFTRPDAGFFLWLRVDDDTAVTKRLWRHGVKVMPGSILGRRVDDFNPGDGYVRVALVHDLPTVRELLQRIKAHAG